MTTALLGILSVVVKAVLEILFGSAEAAAQAKAETYRKETEEVFEVVEAERRIRDRVKEVIREGVRPEDVFAPDLSGPGL